MTEETYKQNNNTSIIFIAHSMGGPMLQVFFQKMSQEWKDKHVRAVISLCGAWAGSVKALKVYVVGKQFFVTVQYKRAILKLK